MSNVTHCRQDLATTLLLTQSTFSLRALPLRVSPGFAGAVGIYRSDTEEQGVAGVCPQALEEQQDSSPCPYLGQAPLQCSIHPASLPLSTV